MADKGQRKPYVPSALMHRYMAMDPQQAQAAQTSQWLEGMQQERRAKQAETTGLTEAAGLAAANKKKPVPITQDRMEAAYN